MDKCYKLIVALLVFINVLIPAKIVQADDTNLNLDNINQINIKSLKQSKKEVINITNEDLLLLSKLVTGEARGETYEGQVAVAAVVINRVKDPRFPNSIKDVIYQKNAFSVVNDGSINMQPTESAYNAAVDALYGKDPTDKAVFFWNPDIATCKWIKTLNPYLKIGNHVFAK